MSFDTQEKSRYSGDPVEAFDFLNVATHYRYTSSDVPVTIGGNMYTPTPITCSGADFSQEDSSASITVTLPRTDAVAAFFLAYTPVQPITLTIHRKHRSDAESVVSFIGTIVSVAFSASEAKFTVAPITQAFKRRIPSIVYQSQCNWALYGAGCGLDKDDFKVVAIVDAVSGNTVTATEFGAQANGWWTNGWLQKSNGERRFIVDHSGEVVTLMSPFSTLAVSESVDAYPGCDRTEAICASKFNNLINHMGWARIPTRNPYEQEFI